MRTLRPVSFASLLLLALLPFQAASQTPITADLVTDRTHIAPGSQTTLVIEITNPADSGISVERYGGAGYSSSHRQLQPYSELAVNNTCGQSLCPVDSAQGFPLHPGASAQFYWNILRISAGAPVGHMIRISDINLKLSGSEYRSINDVHLQRDFVAIVASDGQGDPAALNALNTINPKAGSADIKASLVLDYPDSVGAGKHIEVSGTLHNQGDEPIAGLLFWAPIVTWAVMSAHSGKFPAASSVCTTVSSRLTAATASMCCSGRCTMRMITCSPAICTSRARMPSSPTAWGARRMYTLMTSISTSPTPGTSARRPSIRHFLSVNLWR